MQIHSCLAWPFAREPIAAEHEEPLSAYKSLPVEEASSPDAERVRIDCDRERCHRLLEDFDDEDVLWSLQQWLQKRPHLRSTLVQSRSPTVRLSRPSTMSTAREALAMAASGELDEIGKVASMQMPILQFASQTYLCNEQDSSVTVEVLRIGDLSRPTQVEYETQDFTGIAGSIYVAAKGTLSFAPGEWRKAITIEICNNDQWDLLLTFGVVLKREGLVGATLSRRQCQVEVQVIDDDVFPTNHYIKDVQAGTIEQIPPSGLIFQYFVLQWGNPRIRLASVKMMLVGLFHNLHFLLKVFLSLHLIDNILKHHDVPSTDKMWSLLAMSIATIISFGIKHWLDYTRLGWGLAGMSRMWIQKQLLRKYFQSRASSMPEAVLILATGRDASDLVGKGYMSAIALVQYCGEVFMLACFQLIAPVLLHHPIHWGVCLEVLLFPIVSVFIMRVRNQETVKLVRTSNNAELDIVDGVREACNTFRLISDYKQHGLFIKQFEREVQEFNKADVKVRQRLLNNVVVCPWISVLLVSSYIIVGGWRVINGKQTLGLFLATITIITQMGDAFAEIFQEFVNMQTAFPALLRITKLLNQPTSLDESQRLHGVQLQECRYLERELQEMARSDEEDARVLQDVPLVDLLPIRIKDPCFMLDIPGCDHMHTLELMGSMQVQQGKLISIIGPHAQGKTTVLRVLSGVVVPVNWYGDGHSRLLMPQHLRVLHVSSEPMFFNASLRYNLTFGLPPDDPDGNEERVQAILQRLGLEEAVTEAQQVDPKSHMMWLQSLSETQRALLCMARALITNPEVLCIEKPTLFYNDNTSRAVLELLVEHVRSRGLEMHHVPPQDLRPRTCIMTNVNSLVRDYADEIFLVKEGTITQLDMNNASEETLNSEFSPSMRYPRSSDAHPVMRGMSSKFLP